MATQFYLVERKLELKALNCYKKKKKRQNKQTPNNKTAPKKTSLPGYEVHRKLHVDSDNKACRKKVFASVITK